MLSNYNDRYIKLKSSYEYDKEQVVESDSLQKEDQATWKGIILLVRQVC